MPSLARLLQDHDLGHLRIIADLWGLDPPPGRTPQAAIALAAQMLDASLAVEIAQSLPTPSRQALDDLLAAGGRESMGDLTLRFGPMRPVGPGRRDRDQPWRDSQAALDGLWYRGFIGLAFFETPSGPVEFAFIPDDLLTTLRGLMPFPATTSLAPSAPPALITPAGGAADDAVTLLAALRRKPARHAAGLSPALVAALQKHLVHPESLPLIQALLLGLGVLVAEPLRPDPARVRDLLASGRDETEATLIDEWRRTRRHNDLANTPGLAAPRDIWPNDPAASRSAVLSRLSALGSGLWFDLEAVIREIRHRHPAFLRPGGDFESWHLKDARRGRLLEGVSDWELVEGALLRHTIAGPLHWLGAADLGREPDSTGPTHFRLRFDPATVSSLGGAAEDHAAPARVLPDGQVIVPRQAPLARRYQVARFAEWTGRDHDTYRYRLTPRALASASAQGLDLRKVEEILQTGSGRAIPETLHGALERWARSGTEAVLEATVILRVKDAETLRRMRSDPAIKKYLEEVLGPTTVRIRPRNREALLAAAARRGLLIQPED
jgi:hypothetical protein